jgi:hypothetical protein
LPWTTAFLMIWDFNSSRADIGGLYRYFSSSG